MNSNPSIRIIIALALLFVCANACAYIGPGAGLSVLGSLWALLVGIVIALFAILSWPLRILWRRIRGKRRPEPAQENDPA